MASLNNQEIDGKCYFVQAEAKIYSEALQECIDNDATLAEIEVTLESVQKMTAGVFEKFANEIQTSNYKEIITYSVAKHMETQGTGRERVTEIQGTGYAACHQNSPSLSF